MREFPGTACPRVRNMRFFRLPLLRAPRRCGIIISNANVSARRNTELTEKDLRKLRRADLLEMLVEQARRFEALQKELEAAKKELETRKISISETGSMAEAALKVSGVFDDAQDAAKVYLENIRQRAAEQEKLSAELEEESRRKAEQLLIATAKKCRAMEEETAKKCLAMIEESKKAAARNRTAGGQEG